jgi:heme-degrading monooxygenase HmoA
MPGYVAVWEFRVRPGHQATFAQIYGPEGEWAALFRRAPGFVRSELYRDRAQPDLFLTIDHWDSESAWQAFRAAHAADYEALDRRCAELTEDERAIGLFEPVG